ncbi:MAG: hypothetical protein NTX22_15370 [Ignavibacteriales bacterium]|nr:hypothetical protein [Ignavibacteriales bacterium]
MKKIILSLLCTLLSLQISAQQLGNWKNFTNMKSISDALITPDGIWAATSGGAFYFNFNNSTYSQFNKAKGLGNNQLTTIAVDKNGYIWFGSLDGMIDIYDPGTNTFIKRILEIYNSSKTQKQINDLRVEGDTVYVSTDFGLSLIDVKTFSFFDTFLKFGNITSDTKIKSSFRNKLLFVATENGIAKQKDGATNLSAPESWENYTTSKGLPSNSTFKFVKYKDSIIVSTDKGLAVFTDTTWKIFLPSFNNSLISDMEVRNDSLFILSYDKIYVYSNGIITQPFPSIPTCQRIVLVDKQIYGLTKNGLAKVTLSGINQYIAPDGPSSNFFFGLAVDKNGNLWSGSGSNEFATGFYKFDGSTWTNYTKDDVPNANFNTIIKIYVDPNNTIYTLNWGDGFTRYSNNKFQIFNAFNTDLFGISNNPEFVVVQGLANDARGNLWILTYKSANKQHLAVLKTDSTWQFYSNILTNEILNGYGLLIDQSDTKWMIVGNSESSTGERIFYFNDTKPLYTSDVDGWGSISLANGLNSESINSFAIDRRGEMWIGTSAGINIISNTRDPKKITSLYLLRTQVVNAIAVDALNQKWIGTQQGVFVVSSDGTKILANYNSSNSPLPYDIIKSIAIDNNTGLIYFGTDYGLASLTTPSINPKENFSDILVSPNPVVLDDGKSTSITIDGLIRDTDIKILTITGKLITNFSSPGGRIATWDCRDINGNFVNSGVYLIVAYDKEGNNVGVGKVAIIKK